MTFTDFIAKWNTKGIDFDGAYGDQCMDLMHQYCVEVLGLSDGRILAAPAAKDVWLTDVYGKDKFESIANTPTGVPQKGDIVLWGTGIGAFGHVAIFESGDANKFKSFDQNFPTGSKCHIQEHTYTGVLGWLRYKGTTASTGDIYKGYDLSNRESMKSAVDVLVRVLAGEFVDKSKYEQDIKAQQTTIDTLNQTVRDRDRDIVDLHGQVSSKQGEVASLTDENITLSEQAKQIPELKSNLDQALNDRTLCLNAQETQNKKIGQLSKTSYLTVPTGELFNELVKRLLKVKS